MIRNYSKASSNTFIYQFFSRTLGTIVLTLALFLVFGLIILAAILNSSQPEAAIYALLSFLFIFIFFLGINYLVSLLEYNNLGYIISSQTLSFREGIFSLESVSIPYSKITNISFRQSIMQRFFSVGNLVIDQEDDTTIIEGLDSQSAHKIMQEVSEKSNIQPISNKK